MIALFGSGKTTQALAQIMSKAAFFEDISTAYLDEQGFWHYPANQFDPSKSTLQIPSPGIPPSHPLIQKSRNLISEYDYFANVMPASIWISGTNGKTTTTKMTYHLLQQKKAQMGGNVGTPLAKLDSNAKFWILETSSFTLHYTKIAKPNIYLLLPITPDHLSWHGSMEAYEQAKLKPLSNMREGDVAIVPQKYASTPSKALVIGYENSKDLAAKMEIDRTKIALDEPFLLDALLALSVQKIVFDICDYEAINSFRQDAHKLEEFYDSEGRLWVDDSKATNIDATMQALKRYRDKKIHLILGGDSKGVDLSPLFEHLHNVHIYAIGKAAKEIVELAQYYGIACTYAGSLDIAVNEIKKVHTKESVALLSPACASLDQFSSYKERGELFKQYVLS
ncbi:UDP-N-acetylmuramoylalanine--D-glutamate ligase [Nitratiruptor sp. YY09-18]|nr:UDP-N-acetylmuramoyl-L-alanine--D-glutamate ligase [Nitratiruptor sp. YY09-18]BCD67442.1 UDP-N-acetylmuramoylalanine--D-glutamate ligase [Nitratiruptor sp. YY09-18]